MITIQMGVDLHIYTSHPESCQDEWGNRQTEAIESFWTLRSNLLRNNHIFGQYIEPYEDTQRGPLAPRLTSFGNVNIAYNGTNRAMRRIAERSETPERGCDTGLKRDDVIITIKDIMNKYNEENTEEYGEAIMIFGYLLKNYLNDGDDKIWINYSV
jgi:hypothetical protein